MNLDAVLGDQLKLRNETLAAAAAAPEHLRSAFATKLAVVAREAADALTAADQAGQGTGPHVTRLGRACVALSVLGVGSAKMSLFRLADEGTRAVKTTLAQSMRSTTTPAGRAVLVHLLSDDEVQADAIVAISVSPWPEVLPDLIEVAEGDDRAVRLALKAIARCGATCGPNEANAAADFLLEQLDDDGMMASAVDVLLRFGTKFPGVSQRAKSLAQEPGRRQIAGLCLVAACGEDQAGLTDLRTTGPATDEAAARAFLSPLLRDADAGVRRAAEQTWNVLGLVREQSVL